MSDPHGRVGVDLTPVVYGPAHPCPYLEGRDAVFAYAVRMPDGHDGFVRLLDAGFRRSGLYVYRTSCGPCRACKPLRVPVSEFRPNRSQRRALRLNSDLDITLSKPELDAERLALYKRYLAARHDGQMSGDADEIEAGLYRSPLETVELSARRDGVLKVVGIVDLAPGTLSLVYCAYDPDEPRCSYGTAFIQWCIALAESLSFDYVHLGYWVDGSPTMDYKTRFRPHDVLEEDGKWRRTE